MNKLNKQNLSPSEVILDLVLRHADKIVKKNRSRRRTSPRRSKPRKRAIECPAPVSM